MIFEADPDQIMSLDSLMLVRLMKRLLLSECRLVDIPLRAATVPLQITVADGGEDGRVEWTGGVDATNFFPDRFCIFQSKAQNLTESKIKAEVLSKDKDGSVCLNDAISEVLACGGAYIVFCSHPFAGRKIVKLQNAIEATIREVGADPGKAAAIVIYEANRIADWINTHTAVALWLASQNRGRSLAGFLSHEGWGRSPEICGVDWVIDDAPRFSPTNLVIPKNELKDPARNAWTFEQAAEEALKHLSKNNATLRIAGPSGFGKTRFAFELFNRQATAAEQMENASAIYVDLSVVGNEVAKLALEIADAGWPTILVVDECPDDDHLKLARFAQRAGSRLRLVTIDVETKIGTAKDTITIRLEPAPDETIGAIARKVAPDLSQSDTRFIQELSHGFPQMAVLAARQNADGRQTIRFAEQMLERIIWGRRAPNDEAQSALEFLSLFEWVGLSGRVADQAAFIAKEFAGIPEASFVAHVKTFKSRGIVVQRGDSVGIEPIPLAARLGARRLSLLPDGKLASAFGKAPAPLQASLLRRFRWLDTVPEAKAFARALLAPETLGNFEALSTQFGAECLDRLVHVDPDTAMITIDRVFGGLSIADLETVTDGRRHLVWALEKLAFRKRTFDRAALLLRRLASVETEDGISNNATGVFKQLYQLSLSGTEADPAARLLVLDDGLRSDHPRERELCVEALNQMLYTHHFSRSSGAEEIGSGQPLRDWAPRTYGEIREFYRAGVNRLTEIAVTTGPLAQKARDSIGSHIRGLINQLPLAEIKESVEHIVTRHGLWPEVIQGVNAWLYYDRNTAPREIGEAVRAYFDELMPNDPVECVALYTYGWQTAFHNPDIDYDREDRSSFDFEYSSRKAIELAGPIVADPLMLERALDKFATSDAKTVFGFARRVAELSADPVSLFNLALAKAEATDLPTNRQFFSGLIAGTDVNNPESARICVRAALKSEKLKKDAISLIGAGKLQSADIRLVVSLIDAGDIEPRQCAILSYGQGMAPLSFDEIMPLLNALARHGAEGLWTVLDIVSMVLHGGREPSNLIQETVKSVLVSPELFERKARGTMDGHHLEEMVKLLARNQAVDRKFVRALANQLFGLCEQSDEDVFRELDGPVRETLKILINLYPKEVWAEGTRLFFHNDWLVQHRLEDLIEGDQDDHLAPGLFFDLPSELYLDWVRTDPTRRAAAVMTWLPIVCKADDGILSWHPALDSFVAEFGAEEHVLRNLAIRLHPSTWWGSIAPHLEPLLPLLESWSAHPRPEVRRWAHQRSEYLRAEIDEAN